jgi:hypothetical protein
MSDYEKKTWTNHDVPPKPGERPKPPTPEPAAEQPKPKPSKP